MMRSEADNKSDSAKQLIHWDDLDKEQKTTLLVEYGYYLDTLPPTCSLQSKNERFAQWLAEKNIFYAGVK